MKILSSLKRKFRFGFTLIELLLVIGIIAILAAIVIVAINPTKQLGDARDAQRRSDVNTILNAVYQYAIDNNGSLPSGIPTNSLGRAEIWSTGNGVNGTGAAVNGTGALQTASLSLSTGANLGVLTGSYLVNLPVDPQSPSNSGTYYSIFQDANGRVTVQAETCEADGCSISVTR